MMFLFFRQTDIRALGSFSAIPGKRSEKISIIIDDKFFQKVVFGI